MGGAIPPFPQYAFMAWCSVRGSTGTTLPLPLLITKSEQVIPSALAQRIIVEFLTDGSAKSAKILARLRAQFCDETLLWTQVYDCSKSFKEGRTEVENRS
jgi:hypothetical protein